MSGTVQGAREGGGVSQSEGSVTSMDQSEAGTTLGVEDVPIADPQTRLGFIRI